MVPFSVLDLSPISEGQTPRDALSNSLELARRAEELDRDGLVIKSPHGDRFYKDDLDEGWFGEIALRLDVW